MLSDFVRGQSGEFSLKKKINFNKVITYALSIVPTIKPKMIVHCVYIVQFHCNMCLFSV